MSRERHGDHNRGPALHGVVMNSRAYMTQSADTPAITPAKTPSHVAKRSGTIENDVMASTAKRNHLRERILGFAGKTSFAVIVKRALFEADPGDYTAHEAMFLLERTHRQNHWAADQAKIARVYRDGHATQYRAQNSGRTTPR